MFNFSQHSSEMINNTQTTSGFMVGFSVLVVKAPPGRAGLSLWLGPAWLFLISCPHSLSPTQVPIIQTMPFAADNYEIVLCGGHRRAYPVYSSLPSQSCIQGTIFPRGSAGTPGHTELAWGNLAIDSTFLSWAAFLRVQAGSLKSLYLWEPKLRSPSNRAFLHVSQGWCVE